METEKWENEYEERYGTLEGAESIKVFIRETLASEKQRVVEAVMKLFVVYLGDNDEITLMTEGRNQGLKDVLSALQGERREGRVNMLQFKSPYQWDV